MPRKSSKTAHVMNLLAGDGRTKDTETAAKQDTVREEPDGLALKPAQPEAGGVSETAADTADPVAELIRERLEEELEQPLGQPGLSMPEGTEPQAEPAGSRQEADGAKPQAEPAGSRQEAEEAKPQAETAGSRQETDGAKPQAEPAGSRQEAEEAKPQAEPAGSRKEAEEAKPQAEPAGSRQEADGAEPESQGPQDGEELPPAQSEDEPDYQYVNVMEKIVNDEVLYFMKEFNMCMCDRCIADTKALALTRMPAKYIVKEKAVIPPLMNYYANKFIGYVTVELTKACTVVKETPHHNR